MTRAGLAYLLATIFVASGALGSTVAVYVIWEREAPETLSAAIVNTAAVLAAAAFAGVFDMFFTMQQNRQHSEERREWLETVKRWREEDVARAEQRQQEEAARIEQRQQEEAARAEQHRQEEAARYEQRRQDENAFMERMLDNMMTRFVESLERIEQRNNGNGNGATKD